ncbi:neutral zinc metallopeptidase [Actinomyces sp. 2119]|uniref:Neutral zinc metallopeptidase n=1 Tax=Actinomyces lilanjuaniae TaxID=2321394 RepID=A0ABM6Z6M5_9ACTO|nr:MULTISPECIES: neutral zinc metallopeptidase [Actinomyces]AYD90825.1 neutral zinc metallopeptidase [Actinomyces lilanjuaniae]RJF44651.1 neutral zinc metallopeptidase [Actinomyces sp. 2119]
MSFNRDIKIDPNRVSTRSGGRRGAFIGGGSVLTVVALMLVSQLTGIDLTGLLGAQQDTTQVSTSSTIDTSVCTDGVSANEYTQCRMIATAESLDAVWGAQLPAQAGQAYRQPQFVLWDGSSVSSACGNASSAVGPFYCSGDESVYLDMSFFTDMERTLGAQDTPLAEEYIVAHEFGHHVQHLTGSMAAADRSGAGATSDSVRLELQADCYAGVWVSHAATTPDPDTGQPFLVTPTSAEIQTAINAAESVGDDHIQQRSSGPVDSDSWTHGSSQQRVRWFTTGMEQGTVSACDTFAVSPDRL